MSLRIFLSAPSSSLPSHPQLETAIYHRHRINLRERALESMLWFKLWVSLGVLRIVLRDGSHGMAEALSWGGGRRSSASLEFAKEEIFNPTLPRKSRLPNIYAVAMGELQELESEPLCHRIAARLLVNNCQLLDGKDDATVLTDSGRQVRDFVDSYAASLAICDLERGRFVIPSACFKFREDALARVPVPDTPRLHVSSQEIDSCLSGLAQSDSAWNTWVSYRHKSLRFCEAARADNEKAQSLYLYQRLTQVLEKLTEGVEAELEKHWQLHDIKVREALAHLDDLTPRVDRLRDNGSADIARESVESARSLQQLITILLRTVLENSGAVAAAHEGALQEVSQRANTEISVVMATLTAAAATSAALYDQLELSRLRATELEDRQTHLEQLLDQAQEKTDGILQTLKEASESASAVQLSSLKSGWTGWWPFFVWLHVSVLGLTISLQSLIQVNLPDSQSLTPNDIAPMASGGLRRRKDVFHHLSSNG
ncbi:hypothetical protein SODALDRAFT_381859 [Sodiomyces alkalinus F11]|uniref:Nuclear membrane fusion protein Kar5 n=1 Tax=Sodiomyces alkalinus (strain CBS 110278 / VKM F-3762 / F11) TaxID=1314773 RepID=A0A3N2PKC8_SODAK|nr:hypothetical protein SODALDRAFT_381859 [Sodiomyces alkalinus F11]ROT34880.1 hypothetical protein SODALDRAFT_381859 [Sodiomyces alkalinus F11]